ncbi:hypothetical protein CRG98_007541 [Punica granatum]|uniref:Uncharacterized protein n=1 Tax=Punica granatum TaxID=22663 RepID=A0A2I0KUE5_PUNGR|nr:hypothetical protein CRG98_007541 [Punica granatum]
MHLRGARRSGRAVGVHGRLAGGVRRTGHVRGRAAGAWCARRDTRNSSGMVISRIPLKSCAVAIIHNLIVSSILIWYSIDSECTIGRNMSNNRIFTRNNSICPMSVFRVLTSTQA